MKPGYFYQHAIARDIYIDVLHVRTTQEGKRLVHCRVFGTYGNPHFELTSFYLRENERFWERYSPVISR